MDTLTIPQILYDGIGIKSTRSPILETEEFQESKHSITNMYELIEVSTDMFSTLPFALYYLNQTFSYYFFTFDNFQGLTKLKTTKKIGLKTTIKETCSLIESIHGIDYKTSKHLIFRDFNNRNAPILKNNISSLFNKLKKQKNIAIPVFLAPYFLLELYKNDIEVFICNMNHISKTYYELSQINNDNLILLEKEQFDCNFNNVLTYYKDLQSVYRMIKTDTKAKQEYLVYQNITKYFIDVD